MPSDEEWFINKSLKILYMPSYINKNKKKKTKKKRFPDDLFLLQGGKRSQDRLCGMSKSLARGFTDIRIIFKCVNKKEM